MIRTVLAFAIPSIAFAQQAAPASPAMQGGEWASILPLLFIAVIFYVLILRPQQKRFKQHQLVLEQLKKGDMVVTGGGKIGKVLKVEDSVVHIELAPGVEVKVLKGTISGLHGVAAAAAEKPVPAKASAKKKSTEKNDNIVPSKDNIANDN